MKHIVISDQGAGYQRRGQAWMYASNLIKMDEGIENGEPAEIVTEAGEYLGTGLVSLNSHILVRILSRDRSQPIDEALFRTRIHEAYMFRKTAEPDNLDNCRLIFGEADLLPGFLADRYNDVIVTQISSYGMEQRKDMLYRILLEELAADHQTVNAVYERNDVKIILQSMNTFINFIDAKDPYTRGHSRRVAMYAAEIAKRMGLSEDEIQNIYYAGLLHDAGKISVPDAVLNKPGKLSDEERKLIQNHTVAGGKMLLQLSSLRGVRETALYHHERYDGTGYPDGLKGDIIPLYARIVGVADSYDAMSSNRVYRRHLNKDEIIEEIQKGSGTQFDPSIVKYMVDMINDGYVNVVKMETAEADENHERFHLTEDDIPGVYMGFQQ